MTRAWLLALIAGFFSLQPLSTDLFQPALPAIGTGLAASVAEVQLTLTVFILVFGLWQLVAGPLSDRIGRRPVILFGLFAYVAASLLCVAAPSMPWLVFGRAGQALGACSCLVCARAMVRDSLPPLEGARLLAMAGTIFGLVPLFGPILGGILLDAIGWRANFGAMLVGSAALALAALSQLKETNRAPNPHALKVAPLARSYAAVLRSPAWHAYTWPAVFSYAGLFSFISGGSFVLIRVLGVSPFGYGLCFSFVVAGYILGTLICRRTVARFGMQASMVAGAWQQLAASLVLGTLALAGVHHWAAIVLPHFVYMVAHGQIQPTAQAGSVAQFPRSAGAASAVMGLVMMLVAAATGQWIGASFNGTVYPLALTMAAGGICTAISTWLLVRRHGHVG